MTFNKFGALIVVPALVKVIRPGFMVNRVTHAAHAAAAAQEVRTATQA